jgi:hypothetical protein
MMYRSAVLLTACAICGAACVGPTVDVTTLHPAPHALAQRTIESVATFATEPDGSVAIYRIEASGGAADELASAIHAKAAELGCDGLVITLAQTHAHTVEQSTTGALNDHRTVDAARISALCVIVPIKTGSR